MDLVCDRNVIKEVYENKDVYIKSSDFMKEYKLEKEFTSGKGQAVVLLIKSDEGKKILKIYPNTKVDDNIEETFITCMLASLPSYPARCTGSSKVCAQSSDFFPHVYQYGNIKGPPLYSTMHNYMLIEYIKDGIPLLELLETDKKYIDKYKEEILFQILYAIWYARIHGTFQHNDLHPENIIIIKDCKKSRTYTMKENRKRQKFRMRTGSPMVKLIDFGNSIVDAKYKSRPMTGVLYTYLRKQNIKRKVILEQISKLRAYNSDVSFWLMMKLAFMKPDDQIQLDDFCKTIYQCLNKPFFDVLKVK